LTVLIFEKPSRKKEKEEGDPYSPDGKANGTVHGRLHAQLNGELYVTAAGVGRRGSQGKKGNVLNTSRRWRLTQKDGGERDSFGGGGVPKAGKKASATNTISELGKSPQTRDVQAGRNYMLFSITRPERAGSLSFWERWQSIPEKVTGHTRQLKAKVKQAEALLRGRKNPPAGKKELLYCWEKVVAKNEPKLRQLKTVETPSTEKGMFQKGTE